jgi:hypothetical protein
MNARPYHLLASTKTCPDVTEWEHVYEEYYRCRCCGQTKPVSDLQIVDKGGRL